MMGGRVIRGDVSFFFSITLKIQDCNDNEAGSSEDEKHNAWDQMLELFAHHACSPVLQRCLQEEDVWKAALSCHFALDVFSMCEV